MSVEKETKYRVELTWEELVNLKGLMQTNQDSSLFIDETYNNVQKTIGRIEQNRAITLKRLTKKIEKIKQDKDQED